MSCLKHLLIATLSVTLLIALALGWRESGVVLLAVPVTLALTLAVFYLYGYTLNRVTLFALIFSIGILVDDAIVVVENIVRHFRLPASRGRPLAEVAVEAVDEVGNPTILATFAVIGAILPMAFVRGLMGPYMRPIPVGASAAMLFSLMVAFVVSPWAALRLLRNYAGEGGHDKHETEGWTTRLYRRMMNPLILDARRRWMFLGGVVVLLLAAVAFVPLKWVRVKMLPFDNKSEFQVIIDMPDGTPLEQTTRVAQALGNYLGQQPEVTNYQIYAGTLHGEPDGRIAGTDRVRDLPHVLERIPRQLSGEPRAAHPRQPFRDVGQLGVRPRAGPLPAPCVPDAGRALHELRTARRLARRALPPPRATMRR